MRIIDRSLHRFRAPALGLLVGLLLAALAGCAAEPADPETGAGHKGPEVIATDANFDEVIAEGVVLVDFYADWCPPCRQLAPTISALAKEYAGRATVAKLDVDANRRTAGRFSVGNIPTIILFRDGEPVDRIVGARAGRIRAALAAAAPPAQPPAEPETEAENGGGRADTEGENGNADAEGAADADGGNAKAKPLVATDANFAEITADGVVLVDFWADWCTLCHMISPIVDTLAAEYAGRATVAKVDHDANPETVARLGVNRVPAILVFRDGEEVARLDPPTEESMREALEAALGAAGAGVDGEEADDGAAPEDASATEAARDAKGAAPAA